MTRTKKRAKRPAVKKRKTAQKKGSTAKGMRKRYTLAQGKTVKSVMMRIDMSLANIIRARAKSTGVTVAAITRNMAAHLEKGK